MQKAGLAPTGILANAAKTLGFASVAALLAVNPDAAGVMQAAKEAKPQVSPSFFFAKHMHIYTMSCYCDCCH